MRSLLLAILIAFVPAVAEAATVSVTVYEGGGGKYEHDVETVLFQAAPGEVNDLRITRTGMSVRFADVVPIRPGSGCRAVDATTVDCDTGLLTALLGDGDDRARCGANCTIDGEAGADLIEALPGGSITANGGEGEDVLRGRDGFDSLAGGPDADVLEGGGGHDDFTGDGPAPPYAPDRIDGGDSELDRLMYGDRTTPLHVTLGAPGGGGAAGESDVITGIERLEGGLAADVLVGDDGPNHIWGSPGGSDTRTGDRLIGAGGNDRLEGGAGRDLLDGGGGDDFLEGRRGPNRYVGGDGDDQLNLDGVGFDRHRAQAALDCGPGDDRVTGPGPRDRLAGACEAVEYDGLLLSRLPTGLGFRTSPVQNLLACPARLVATSGRRMLSRRFTQSRPTTLRFPGFATASLELYVRPCWLGKGRRERMRGGFRVTR